MSIWGSISASPLECEPGDLPGNKVAEWLCPPLLGSSEEVCGSGCLGLNPALPLTSSKSKCPNLSKMSFFIYKMGITVPPWGSIKRVEKDNPNNTLSQWFSKSVYQNHRQGGDGVLLKPPRRLSPIPRVSDSVVLGWGQITWISNTFPDDTVMLVQGPHFENHCFLHSTWHVVKCSKMFALVNFNSVFEPV